MKITEAVKHFGNHSKLARALGITPSAVYMRQKACGDELSEEWAMKLHFATKGKLKFTQMKFHTQQIAQKSRNEKEYATCAAGYIQFALASQQA